MTRVYTHFSGSPCVVEITPGALNLGSNGIYIDVRRHHNRDHIEVVQAGQVKQRFKEQYQDAPGRIIELMKELT